MRSVLGLLFLLMGAIITDASASIPAAPCSIYTGTEADIPAFVEASHLKSGDLIVACIQANSAPEKNFWVAEPPRLISPGVCGFTFSRTTRREKTYEAMSFAYADRCPSPAFGYVEIESVTPGTFILIARLHGRWLERLRTVGSSQVGFPTDFPVTEEDKKRRDAAPYVSGLVTAHLLKVSVSREPNSLGYVLDIGAYPKNLRIYADFVNGSLQATAIANADN
ncbi:hypothetical protein ACFSM5_12420 [Lacibacterium aquatile]|uniref:Uncharacterized protein n=1 Tax=Lacibacterium aquatile TaxID=1168082 RepID=A0ABW5DT87_9PROT